MSRHLRVISAVALAVGLVTSTAGCSGGSSPDQETSVAPSMAMSDTDNGDDFDDDAIPVPFMDEKTGKQYILMITPSQAECLLDQDMQGVTDIDAVLAACNIDKRAIRD